MSLHSQGLKGKKTKMETNMAQVRKRHKENPESGSNLEPLFYNCNLEAFFLPKL